MPAADRPKAQGDLPRPAPTDRATYRPRTPLRLRPRPTCVPVPGRVLARRVGRGVSARHVDPVTRFWSYVDKTGMCWLWTGSLDRNGYGCCSAGLCGTRKAHRVAYQLVIGPIPEGLVIDHVAARGCTSKACVNPAHLEAVPNRENLLRGKPGEARRRGACLSGHAYTAENTRWKPDGGPVCRVCERERPKKMGVCQDCGGPVARGNAPWRGKRCVTCHRDSMVPEHGTRGRYGKGCRCEPCRQAQRDYDRARKVPA